MVFGGVGKAVNRVDEQVSAANATAANGVNVVNTQAAAANATAAQGVTVLNTQAAAANATAAQGVNVLDAQASAANATAAQGVNVLNAQASAANATAAQGVNVLDAQASAANATAAQGVTVLDAQAAAANATAAQGVNVLDAQAAAANATAAQGVNVLDAQAAAANATAAQGVNVLDAQAAAANATAAQGVNVLDAQAAAANATAAQGVNVLDAQASEAIDMANLQASAATETVREGFGVVNATLDEHLNNLTPAAETLMNDISEQIGQLSNPLLVIASLVGPLQVLTGANIILTILTTLNVIRGVQGRLLQTAKDIKVELAKITDAVKEVRDVLHAGNVVQMVRNITGDTFKHEPAILVKGGTTTVQCFAFYSSAESCVSQLKGSNFWAYSSIKEMFSLIYEFSTLAKISSNTAAGIKLHLNVYFLDPQPEHPITIPHFHFAGESIEFINHSPNKKAIVFQRLFVAADSQLSLKGVQVNSLVSLGRTKLVNCIVQFDPKESIPAPALERPAFVGIPHKQVNYSVVGGSDRITYDGCVYPEKKQKGIRGKVSSALFKPKQKKGIITNFCRGVCIVTSGDDAEAELNPGGQVIFQRKYEEKERSGSWIKLTIQDSEAGTCPSALHWFSEGDDLQDLLFLYRDYSADIIKTRLDPIPLSVADGLRPDAKQRDNDDLDPDVAQVQRGIDPPADIEH
jgi:hypothetical protein